MWRPWARRVRAALLRTGPGPGCGPRSCSSSSSSGRPCWSCGRALPSASSACNRRFCPACRALQPPDEDGPAAAANDLFALLGCERTFQLDEAELTRRFRSLQRRLHPDAFAASSSSQAERRFSEQHSALVNRAYSTLRSPLSRGLHLLELNGVELEKGTDSEADPEFLSEIMEINEKLIEANSEDTREELESFIAARQEELIKEVSRAFDQDDLQKAKQVLAKMKYFANLEEKLKREKIPS